MAKAPAPIQKVEIEALKTHSVIAKVVSTSPLFFNSMSAKAQRTLLLGGGKKTAAQRREVKHNPYEEFQNSVYHSDIPRGKEERPTLLGFPAAAFKGAMATAALETAGVTKKSVERLLFMPQERAPIWGTPFLRCDVVRSADIARTPDIRTRAFLPVWCSEIIINYVGSTLTQQSVLNLLQNAGMLIGIGDFRQEKGRGCFGTFRVCKDDDEEWHEIAAMGGFKAQTLAMREPAAADENTEILLGEYEHEVARRAEDNVMVPKGSAEDEGEDAELVAAE